MAEVELDETEKKDTESTDWALEAVKDLDFANEHASISFEMAKIEDTRLEIGSSICAPILLNGIKVMAAVDCGASHSFISPEIVGHLGVEIIKQDGHVSLAAKGMPRKGHILPLEVQSGNIKTKHAFEIFEIADGFNCAIGEIYSPN